MRRHVAGFFRLALAPHLQQQPLRKNCTRRWPDCFCLSPLTPCPPAAREPQGPPYLTPTQYHAGEGDIAVCAGPMYGGDHHGGVLAEWAEFQKLMGVTKV